jgi:hypothetical protein
MPLPLQAGAASNALAHHRVSKRTFGDPELDNDNEVDTNKHHPNLNPNSQGGGSIMDVDVGGMRDPVRRRRKR